MSKTADEKYLKLGKKILRKGFSYTNERRGVTRVQIASSRFSVKIQGDEIPTITSKEVHLKSVLGELLWFLSGDNNITSLKNNNISIWDKDAYNWYLKKSGATEPLSFKDFILKVKTTSQLTVTEDYDLGSVGRNYSVQWRDFNGVDQINNLLENLKKNPMESRHIVTAWNPKEINETALPPCHWAFEILVQPYKKSYGFTLKWSQRSVDFFLGLPFNITSYGILGHIIAAQTGYTFLELEGNLSNIHFYENSIHHFETQLKNAILSEQSEHVSLPRFNKVENLFKGDISTFNNLNLNSIVKDIGESYKFLTPFVGMEKVEMIAPKKL